MIAERAVMIWELDGQTKKDLIEKQKRKTEADKRKNKNKRSS